MKKLLFLSVLAVLACNRTKQQDGDVNVVVPTPKQIEWADCEIGVLIHFDMPVFKPEYEWREFGTHPEPSTFNPSEMNTDQWLEAAQNLGAKYAVLVAKHCSGFSLWPTEAHEYSVKNSSWRDGKGDVVADFVASCRKYGIKPGIYASTSANGYLYVDGHKIADGAPVTREQYNKVVETQLSELWGNYGELFEVWFDGGLLAMDKGGADVLSLVNKYQPNAIAFQGPFGHPNLIRWVGNEEGAAPYPCWATTDSTTNADGTIVVEGLNGAPDAPYWCPGESDFTLRWNRSFQGGWFWHADEDETMFTLDELMKKYETSVGRNTNMLLGIVIDNRGLVPDADFRRIKEFGDAIKANYSSPIAKTSGNKEELVVKFDAPMSVDRVVIQEDIAKGERVLQYEILGRQDGKWNKLSEGTNIGHKRIERFEPCMIDALKLSITKSKSVPQIKNFAVYKTL